jgi:hypothetical protein
LTVVSPLSLPNRSDAQEPAGVWIQSFTADASAGILTITGTSFSDTCEVTRDGQALTVLSGATASRLVKLSAW